MLQGYCGRCQRALRSAHFGGPAGIPDGTRCGGQARIALRRPTAASVLLAAINQSRLLTAVWFIQAMGNRSGFYWGRTLAGSLITIAGIAVSPALYTLIFSRWGKAALKRGSAAQ
jgi:hypothetical protein